MRQKRHSPGLLTGRAPGDPDDEFRSSGGPALCVEAGQDIVPQQIDLGGVAEEISFVDQHSFYEIEPVGVAR